jgi:hypothetical protein
LTSIGLTFGNCGGSSSGIEYSVKFKGDSGMLSLNFYIESLKLSKPVYFLNYINIVYPNLYFVKLFSYFKV